MLYATHICQLFNQEVKVACYKIKADITSHSFSTGFCQRLFVCYFEEDSRSQLIVTCIGHRPAFEESFQWRNMM